MSCFNFSRFSKVMLYAGSFSLLSIYGCGKVIGPEDAPTVSNSLMSINLVAISSSPAAKALAKKAGFLDPLDILKHVKNPKIALAWVIGREIEWERADGKMTDANGFLSGTENQQVVDLKNVTLPFQMTFNINDLPQVEHLLRRKNSPTSQAGMAMIVLFSDVNGNNKLDANWATGEIGPYGYCHNNEFDSLFSKRMKGTFNYGDTTWGDTLKPAEELGKDWIIGVACDYAVVWVSDSVTCNELNKTYTEQPSNDVPFTSFIRYSTAPCNGQEEISASHPFNYFSGLKPGYNLIKAEGISDVNGYWNNPMCLLKFEPISSRWYLEWYPKSINLRFSCLKTLKRVESNKTNTVSIRVSDDYLEFLQGFLFYDNIYLGPNTDSLYTNY